MRVVTRPWLGLGLMLAAALALLPTLPGCTREPASKAFAGKGIQLSFMFWGDPAEVQTVRHYINEFQKANPGIAIQLIHQPSSVYRDNLRIRVIGNDAPDVMYMGLEDFAGFAADGAILPLDELMAKDPEFKREEFYPAIIDQFRYRGKLYGLAKDFSTLVVYFNKDLFDKWEVPYPKADWTWDDFLKTAKALTHRRDAGEGAGQDEYGVVLETWIGQILPWIWQNGGRIVDEDKQQWLMGQDPWLERNAEALQFLADLIWKHKVAPSPSTTRNAGTSEVFKGGRAAMFTSGRWMCMQFKEIRKFDWDVAPLPRRREKATCLFTAAYAISSRTKQREASWALVKFLTAKDCQAAVANAGMAIPVLKGVAESKAFTKPKALGNVPLRHHVFLDSVGVAKTPPRLVAWPEVRTVLSDGLQPVFNNRRTAREALIALQAPLQAIIDKQAARRREGASGATDQRGE